MIYKELFSILTQHARRLQLRFRPQIITTDFESAMIKTIADEVGSVLFSLQLMILSSLVSKCTSYRMSFSFHKFNHSTDSMS